MPEKIVAPRTYVLVCAMLLGLTLATIGLARLDLHGWNNVLALTIAAAKAVLIGVFFMHLRSTSGMTRLVGVAALLWLSRPKSTCWGEHRGRAGS